MAQVTPSTLLTMIADRAQELRNSEQVAAVILSDPAAAVGLNMAGLADAAGVSEPTVMRFCTAVGFHRFRSFKIALAQAVALSVPIAPGAIQAGDDTSALAEKIFDHTISSLDRVHNSISATALADAIDLVANAREIQFVGFGTSGIVAQDAQQKFPLFGVPCQALIDYHQQYVAATLSTTGTVMVAISNSAKTREIIVIAEAAKNAGAKVVTITGADGLLVPLADVDLRVETLDNADLLTPTVSRLASLVIIDIMAIARTARKCAPVCRARPRRR
jgi:RpiR family carbohydrate utilization transcriptional regulator